LQDDGEQLCGFRVALLSEQQPAHLAGVLQGLRIRSFGRDQRNQLGNFIRRQGFTLGDRG
jgi:hypothetical protein